MRPLILIVLSLNVVDIYMQKARLTRQYGDYAAAPPPVYQSQQQYQQPPQQQTPVYEDSVYQPQQPVQPQYPVSQRPNPSYEDSPYQPQQPPQPAPAPAQPQFPYGAQPTFAQQPNPPYEDSLYQPRPAPAQPVPSLPYQPFPQPPQQLPPYQAQPPQQPEHAPAEEEPYEVPQMRHNGLSSNVVPDAYILDCPVNEFGYKCCSNKLLQLMNAAVNKQAFNKATKGCNMQKGASLIQAIVQSNYNMSFEAIVSPSDFASNSHFRSNLWCKTRAPNGKVIMVYATPRQYTTEPSHWRPLKRPEEIANHRSHDLLDVNDISSRAVFGNKGKKGRVAKPLRKSS